MVLCMAIQLDPEKAPRKRAKYPWHQWADGNVWLLERGDDYAVPDETMISAARQWAVRKQYDIRIEKHRIGIVVQFVKFTPVKKKLRRP